MSQDDKTAPITHIFSVTSIALLGINDHYLKDVYPSWLTGKLSDFAGMVFFPLLVELLVRNRKIAVALTGLGFTLAKTTVIGNDVYNQFFQYMYSFRGDIRVVPLVMDYTDCIALPFLFIPLFLIPKRCNEI